MLFEQRARSSRAAPRTHPRLTSWTLHRMQGAIVRLGGSCRPVASRISFPVALEARAANVDGLGHIGIRELVGHELRMRRPG